MRAAVGSGFGLTQATPPTAPAGLAWVRGHQGGPLNPRQAAPRGSLQHRAAKAYPPGGETEASPGPLPSEAEGSLTGCPIGEGQRVGCAWGQGMAF